MYGQLVVFRVRSDLRTGPGAVEIEHDLGRLRAALCRQPGHRSGHVVRSSGGSVIVVNVFATEADARAAAQAVAPVLGDLLRDERVQLIMTEEGVASDVRWSLTRRAISRVRRRDHAYQRLLDVLLAEPDAAR